MPFLRSKLYRPPVAPDAVVRNALLERLEAGWGLPFYLVSAPAGYGKTTLVGQWLERSERPSAWLSLDEADSDPALFLQYFVAAVRTRFPEACHATLALADAPELPPLVELATCLSNDLDDIGELFVVVLDDYHRLRVSKVHELLNTILRRPPHGFHLVILSRFDPPLSLASLRGANQLTEVRMKDLQFTSRETATFLEQALGEPVGWPAVERLRERIEGWPVALRLAALALRSEDRVDDLVRGITGHAGQVGEYLVAEVLSHQPATVRDWLSKISILERFCAPLADAVRGPEGAPGDGGLRGQDAIDLLERAGLFCIPLDDGREWYRFHHIFKDLLRSRLEREVAQEEIVALHTRAAEWLESQELFEEAIQHLLEGQGPAAAGRLIGRQRNAIMNQEHWGRLERWMGLLPAEIVDDDIDLLVVKLCMMVIHGRFAETSLMDRALERLGGSIEEPANEAELRGLLDLVGYFRSLVLGDYALALEHAKRARNTLPEECRYARGTAVVAHAVSLQHNGELERAHETVYDALGSYPTPTGGYRARLLTALCILHWTAGDRQAMESAAERVLETGREFGLRETTLFGCYFAGAAQYHGNQLAAAESSLLPLLRDKVVPNSGYFAHGGFALALVHQAKGESGRAREVAQSITDYVLRTGHQPLVGFCRAFQAELSLRQGRIGEAMEWARRFEPGRLSLPWRFYVPEITLAKVLIAEGSADSLGRADDLLRRIEEFLVSTHTHRFLIETLALKALCRDAQGDAADALAALRIAVQIGLPGRWIRPFADLGPRLARLLHHLEAGGDVLRYVGEILAAIQREWLAGSDAAALAPDPGALEPLTPRELEVLALLAERLSNREIAERLFISPGTVKRHAHSLYGKIGVPGRRELVTKALGLGLLGARGTKGRASSETARDRVPRPTP